MVSGGYLPSYFGSDGTETEHGVGRSGERASTHVLSAPARGRTRMASRRSTELTAVNIPPVSRSTQESPSLG